jgi:hypothetical protein
MAGGLAWLPWVSPSASVYRFHVFLSHPTVWLQHGTGADEYELTSPSSPTIKQRNKKPHIFLVLQMLPRKMYFSLQVKN